MTLEKKFQQKYGKCLYTKSFSRDFREAVKGVDTIAKTVSKATKEKKIKSNET
jgi:hypothetical protein